MDAVPKKLLRDRARSKGALLRAATELFAPRGVESIATDTIAARAGVNKRLIYYYFRDKAGLYDAAIDAAYMQLEVALLIEGASSDLQALLVDALTFLGTHPAIAKLLVHDLQRPEGRSRLKGRALHRKLEKLAPADSQEGGDRVDVLALLESACQLSLLRVLRPQRLVPKHVLREQVLLGAKFLLAAAARPVPTFEE